MEAQSCALKTLPIDTVVHADSLAFISSLPDESVDLVMTSPPYWGLRDYGVDGQIGLELHPMHYVDCIDNITFT